MLRGRLIFLLYNNIAEVEILNTTPSMTVFPTSSPNPGGTISAIASFDYTVTDSLASSVSPTSVGLGTSTLVRMSTLTSFTSRTILAGQSRTTNTLSISPSPLSSTTESLTSEAMVLPRQKAFSSGAIAGLSVGLILLFILIVVVACFCLFCCVIKRQHKHRSKSNAVFVQRPILFPFFFQGLVCM